jgi:hypothetical protein
MSTSIDLEGNLLFTNFLLRQFQEDTHLESVELYSSLLLSYTTRKLTQLVLHFLTPLFWLLKLRSLEN